MNAGFRHAWYQSLVERFPAIQREASEFAESAGFFKYKDRIGLYAGASSCPARLPRYVTDALITANSTDILPNVVIADQIRDVVKGIYGDDYDVCVTNTCEAALRVAYDTLMAPPTMRRGEAYRSRVLTLLGEDFDWGAGYGRPFPPKYKNITIDRTVAGGELGVDAKSLTNLDTLFVRHAGARYEVHGIKPSVVPLLLDTDAEETLSAARRVAERHAAFVSGVHCIGYDTPGWGYAAKDEKGVPVLFKGLGAIASEFDVPFVIDAAACLPVVGLDPRDTGADILLYSVDKMARAPIAGLAIGKAEPMSVFRKAMGWGGSRAGGASSYSKAVYSVADPGRDSLVGVLAALKALRDEPERFTAPIDGMAKILSAELDELCPTRFRNELVVTKSYHMGGIEINYARTWNGEYGIPLFSLEDLFVGTNAICLATEAMGIAPATIYSGNIIVAPSLGLTDDDGKLDEDATRVACRALVKSIEIVSRYAGLG
jgi:hypothetical protein